MTKKTVPIPARAVSAYLAEVARIRSGGNATEHSYRSALQTLLEAHLPGWRVVNEPARRECGAPDFAVEKNGVALGFVEAKDIGANLNSESKSGQMDRYRAALPNLVLTDYLEFRRYADGNACAVDAARLAIPEANDIRNLPGGAKEFARFFHDFAAFGESGRGESPSAGRLAQMMAGKARLLRDLAEKVAEDESSDLAGVFTAFKGALIRDLKTPQFADIFAQTAVYGMFAARLEAEKAGVSPSEFRRVRAGELLPQTTPFLRRFFNAFAGADMDPRISWMADDIAKMFAVVSLDNVARSFERGGGADDPFLHFYETFLREYDPKKRAARGVYFTPRPVVDFIVRAVDDSLRTRFGIADGLADESKTRFRGGRMHKVQILDPAAGTGAFLSRVAELVRGRVCESAGEGAWREYAPEHLLPRLNGFEILMSAYAMCHLKMSMTLGGASSGLSSGGGRVNVFLTNALEMPEKDIGDIAVMRWLWEEARAANRVKSETPVMVALGNPPYNASSQNSGEWIEGLMRDYKRGLDERNLAPLNDDYIKFIRCAEDFIERNGRGVAAMITNNSFYNGLIHRQMRRRLLETFDEIHILNLRGNANIGERAADGGPDQNVFDIMQGVGIFVMAKTGEKKRGEPARLLYADCRGRRKAKYDFLSRKSMSSVRWRRLSPSAPHFFFVPKTFAGRAEYERGVPVHQLFAARNSGVSTSCDAVSVHFDRASLEDVLENFRKLPASKLRERYSRQRESRSWTFQRAKDGLRDIPFRPAEMCYRPFDIRSTVAAERAGGFIGRPRPDIMRHLVGGDNVALLTSRSFPAHHMFTHAFVARNIADNHSVGGQTYVFPLHLDEREVGNGGAEIVRRANFDPDAAAQFARASGMRYCEKKNGAGVMDAESLFDYIYAVLHRPSYRRKFAEFLRIDFPRVPPAADESEFRRLAKLGGRLRALHLLEAPELDKAGFPFSDGGENVVKESRFAPGARGDLGRVFINARRYFDRVPLAAWEFCVGGYYPAQKWLKDRKGRSLSYDDQRHYRRMLAALARTAELVGEMDAQAF